MCLALVLCVYLGRTAVFVFTVGCILVSNCVVTKQVPFLGTTTSLGVFIFSVTYLANDIVTEYWGRGDAMRLVLYNLAAQIAFMVYSQLAILTPAAQTDTASPAIASLFTITPRITIAAILSAVGGYVCVTLFDSLKQRYPNGPLALALRNSISSIVGNWVNTVVFFSVAFYGVFPNKVLGEILVSAIVVKTTVGILDTPFMFLAGWARRKSLKGQGDA
jgi:uncharacterized integral membrane protein (TIGR00697 family)